MLTKQLRSQIARGGYKSAILIATCVLHDEFDLTEQELVEFVEKCEVLRGSMDAKLDDWQRINKELEKIIGMDIVGGEKRNEQKKSYYYG